MVSVDLHSCLLRASVTALMTMGSGIIRVGNGEQADKRGQGLSGPVCARLRRGRYQGGGWWYKGAADIKKHSTDSRLSVPDSPVVDYVDDTRPSPERLPGRALP